MRFVRLPKARAFAVVALAAAVVLVGWQLKGARERTAAAVGDASATSATLPPKPSWQTLLACSAMRQAPLAAETPLGDGAATCAVLDDVRRMFALAGDAETDVLQAFRASIEAAVTANPVPCAVALSRELASATRCGLVYDAVAIRVVNGKDVPASLIAAEFLRPATCRWKLIAALREAERAEATYVATLLAMTGEADADLRNAAWMTLGTLGRIAHVAAQADTVPCIDGVLAHELEASEGASLPILVGAAGNAGCEACRPKLERLLASEDARIRRPVVAAFRFLESAADVETMCRVGRTDPDDTVRGSATFALRHAKSAILRRVECLYEIATEDAVERVGVDAVASLAELVDGSELVVGTLVEIARETRHAKVRAEAIAVLRGHASDEAIRAALEAPAGE